MYYKLIRPTIRKLYYLSVGLFFNVLSFFVFWVKPKKINKSDVKKILLIKLERIGDLVLSAPAIREIRKCFPKSHISIIVNPYTKDIVDGLPDVDEVLVYDSDGSLMDKLRFVKFLRCCNFDLAIDLGTRNFMVLPVWILYLSGAKTTVGLNNYGRAFLYNIKVKPYGCIEAYPEEVMHILEPLDIKSDDFLPKLFVSKENIDFIEKILDENNLHEKDIKVCIHSCGYYEASRLDEEIYTKICEYIIKKYNSSICFLGSKQERSFIKGIISRVKTGNGGEIVNLSGKLSLGQTMALISCSNFFIGNNSGPLHIACGLDVPTISFLGPSIPKRWSPQGKNNIVLRGNLSKENYNLEYSQNTDYQFLKRIKLEDIIEAIDNQFKKLIG